MPSLKFLAEQRAIGAYVSWLRDLAACRDMFVSAGIEQPDRLRRVLRDSEPGAEPETVEYVYGAL